MKWLRRLAIFTFLALNAEAGWHTNAPYVAWPATNHLRWMTNVITATNTTHWTNAAYAGWTNNYILTNLWKGTNIYLDWTWENWIVAVDLAPFFFMTDEYWGTTSRPAIQGNYYLQAKDARIHDCASALMERWMLLSTNNTASNFYATVDAAFPEEGWIDKRADDWFYRSDVRSLRRCKVLVLDILGSFYHYASETNIIPMTETQLCINAGVPTNFLQVALYDDAAARELHRYAQGSTTPYSAIVTCSWTLAVFGTNIATNVTVDTYGNEVTLIGTNGQKFTAVVTNKYLLPGTRAEQYGWDGMKAVITNLYITAVTNAWGIGFGTNSGAGGASDVDYFSTNLPGAIDPGYLTRINIPTNESSPQYIVAINGWEAYGSDPWGDPFNETVASWYWAKTNPVSLVYTGVAPFGVFSAGYSFSRLDRIGYANTDWDHVGFNYGTNWDVIVPPMPGSYVTTNGLTWFHTNRWAEYQAPLQFTYYGPIGCETRTYAKSNGVAVLMLTTNLAAGSLSITTQPVSVSTPPIPADFGASVSNYVNINYRVGNADSDPADQWSCTISASATTNLSFPTWTTHKTFQFWNFDYR